MLTGSYELDAGAILLLDSCSMPGTMRFPGEGCNSLLMECSTQLGWKEKFLGHLVEFERTKQKLIGEETEMVSLNFMKKIVKFTNWKQLKIVLNCIEIETMNCFIECVYLYIFYEILKKSRLATSIVCPLCHLWI